MQQALFDELVNRGARKRDAGRLSEALCRLIGACRNGSLEASGVETARALGFASRDAWMRCRKLLVGFGAVTVREGSLNGTVARIDLSEWVTTLVLGFKTTRTSPPGDPHSFKIGRTATRTVAAQGRDASLHQYNDIRFRSSSVVNFNLENDYDDEDGTDGCETEVSPVSSEAFDPHSDPHSDPHKGLAWEASVIAQQSRAIEQLTESNRLANEAVARLSAALVARDSAPASPPVVAAVSAPAVSESRQETLSRMRKILEDAGKTQGEIEADIKLATESYGERLARAVKSVVIAKAQGNGKAPRKGWNNMLWGFLRGTPFASGSELPWSEVDSLAKKQAAKPNGARMALVGHSPTGHPDYIPEARALELGLTILGYREDE